MKKFFPLLGLILGYMPTAVLVLTDRSIGHGSDTLSLIFLLAIGIPGMTIGCFVGCQWLHGRRWPVYIAVAICGFFAIIAGFIVEEEINTALRGEDVACLGLLAGGIVGFLLGRAFVSRRSNNEDADKARFDR